MASSLTRPQRVALKTWSPANLKSLWAAYLKKNPGAKLPGTGMAPNVGGFAPFATPDRPPPGTYDPSIDAQERASGRGFGDLQQDTELGNERSQDDYLIEQGELQRHLDRMLADAKTTRTNQHSDYERAIGDLTRNYDRLGNQQAQSANAAGIARGGALQQALEKRTANLTHDREPLDTNEQRAQTEYDLLTGPTGRYQEDFQSRLGALGLGLTRGNEDRATALSRGGRENDQFGLDANAQRWYQSAQAGYAPPGRPASQRGSIANPYKVVKTARGKRRLYHTGYLVNR